MGFEFRIWKIRICLVFRASIFGFSQRLTKSKTGASGINAIQLNCKIIEKWGS